MRSPTKPGLPTGLTMLETVIGGFLILTAILILSALVDTSLRRKSSATRLQLATLVAENKLEELRALAYGTNFRSLDQRNGKSETISSFEVLTKIGRPQLFSPNSSIESARPDDQQKLLKDSVRQVEVWVKWGETAEERYVATTYIADLNNRQVVLKIETENTRVEHNAKQPMTVSAKNESGQPIEDLSYQWYVRPLTGLGAIADYSPSGDKATYINESRASGDRLVVIPGDCKVVVRAVYKGTAYYAEKVMHNNG